MQEPGTTSASGHEGAFPLVSLVWIQRRRFYGLFQAQDPGLLIAREGGSISLVTLKDKVFEAEKHEIVSVTWPWWQFGQGVFLRVAGKTYWFAWIPGTATSYAWEPSAITDVISKLAKREGLDFFQLAKRQAWRSYLKT